MNELQKYQPKLPVSYQRYLTKSTNQLDLIARLTCDALDVEGAIFGYTVFEALKTLTTVEALKMAFPRSAMNPETEALLSNLTRDYLLALQQIPQESHGKILHALKDASVPPEDEGLLQSVTNAFIDWLNK